MNTRNCYGEFEYEKANCKECRWKKICDFYNERVKSKTSWNEILNYLQRIAESAKGETAEMIRQLMQEIEDSNEYLQTVLLPD